MVKRFNIPRVSRPRTHVKSKLKLSKARFPHGQLSFGIARFKAMLRDPFSRRL